MEKIKVRSRHALPFLIAILKDNVVSNETGFPP